MIQGTQSTSNILAANRLRAEQSLLAQPQQIQLGGGNPFSMMSQGISTAANAFLAPETRDIQQANLDRANAIRLEQQAYDRDRQAVQDAQTAETHDLNIDTGRLRNRATSFDLGARMNDRAAEIAGQQAQVAAQPHLAAIDGAQSAEQASFLKQNNVPVGSPQIQLANDISQYDKSKAEGGPSTWQDMMPDSFKKMYLSDAGTAQNIMDDLEDAIGGGAIGKGAKKLAGNAYDPAYENLAIARLMNKAVISPGVWGFGSGDFDEEGFEQALADEMVNIQQAKGISQGLGAIQSKYDKQRSVINRETLKAGLRSK